VAGSSAYYKGGMIPYHTEAKIALLGVQATTVSQYSAVSKETAIEMAQQVRTKFSTDIGLATTGIAGPTGGSKEKPVGTIWIALADEHTTYTEQLQLGNDRLENIHLTAIYLLNLLRKVLQGIK
jgi:nicotinamide-nucleotide amidase